MRWIATAIAVVALAAPATAATKRARAVRAEPAPAVDGDLSDAVWRSAPFVADFAQRDPHEGAPPSRRTEVAFAYDEHALFVAARMYAEGPADIQSVMTRRDDSGQAERIIVSFDTFGDRRTAYSFAVTAAGVRVDWYHTDDSAYARDHSFDPVWQANTRITSNGWTAEMRIPFSQLRFPARDSHTWGVNINRYMPQDNEDVFWIVVPREATGWSSYFGELTGIERIEPSARLELLPYVATDVTLTADARLGDDPFGEQVDFGARAGGDLKLGLGPSLTLDATVNPDFGQVEADPAVVNLSAFETIFPERRPFFTEGGGLLAGNGADYFYSRRIGAAPRGDIDADYVDAPRFTRILGAAKVTGRVRERTSVGTLAALTARTHATALSDGMAARVPVEPITAYGVMRVQHELGDAPSVIGASLTSVYRAMDAGDPLAQQLPRQAYAGGFDGRWRFDGAAFELAGFAGGSAVIGEPAAIEAIQRSSAHYFQRPDQDHVEVDPTHREMLGWTGRLQAEKRKGAWIGLARVNAESPGFEINDLGRLASADEITTHATVTYRDNAPGGPLNHWDAGSFISVPFNFGGIRRAGMSGLSGSLTWNNLWRTTLAANLVVPGLNDDLSRGGPLVGIGPGWQLSASHGSGFGGRHDWSVNGAASGHETGSTGWFAGASATWRPLDRLALTLAPRVMRRDDHRQYIDAIPGANDATFGVRYVFATVERSELAVQTRAQLAFTPTLSLEVYAEPFASTGTFTAFGELPAPRSRVLRRYGTGGTTIAESGDGYIVTHGGESFELPNPDFRVLSLRSTAVLRWEFAPGSAAFLVWQQDREDLGGRHAAADPADVAASFRAPGRNTLALKVSYWWGAD